MYRAGETMRLEEVRDMGINPNAILDIGAHTGQFHSWSKRVWPDVGVFMIEANPLHEASLDRLAMMNGDKYLIAALGDKEREVTFYTRSDKPHTEGNSYYKEYNYGAEEVLIDFFLSYATSGLDNKQILCRNKFLACGNCKGPVPTQKFNFDKERIVDASTAGRILFEGPHDMYICSRLEF